MEFEDDNILLLWWLRVSCVTKLMMQSRYNNTKYQTVQTLTSASTYNVSSWTETNFYSLFLLSFLSFIQNSQLKYKR